MRAFLTCFLLITSFLFSEIIEVEGFRELEKVADHEMLVLIDLDNTLVEPKSSYGGTLWFDHQVNRLLEKGVPINDALAEVNARWLAAQNRVSVKTRDKEASTIIRRLQRKNCTVLALTHRCPECRFATMRQLEDLQVDFSITSPIAEELILDYPHSPRLFEGVIFVHDANEKGAVLKKLMKQLDWKPKKIVFIDDKWNNLLSVDRELSTYGCETHCLHLLDRRTEKFDPQLADLQEYVGVRILSDDAIRAIITGHHQEN